MVGHWLTFVSGGICLQGFGLEDATGLSLNGDLDVQSVFAGTLPTTHPSFAPQKHLEMFPAWQAPPLPEEPVEIFIGILSAGNHFAERMAVRKTWMSAAQKTSNVVARFFVALVIFVDSIYGLLIPSRCSPLSMGLSF